jgi:5-methylcytosine-specific restriction endonuclease McrA
MIVRRVPIARRSTRKGKKTSKRRRSRLALRRECDRIFALAVKERDGWACRACGTHMHPQCAHIVSRRYHATRWILVNAITLCRSHHLKWTHDPLGWKDFIEERFPGRLAQLETQARAGVKWIDYEAILASLTGGGRLE